MESQLQSAKLDIQGKIGVLTQNKTEMDAILAQIQASDSSQEEKDFASTQYASAYAKNEKMLGRYTNALERLDAQLLRLSDPAVKTKVDKIVTWQSENGVSESNKVAEDSLYQTNDTELDRCINVVDNQFLNISQKTKLISGKLFLDE